MNRTRGTCPRPPSRGPPPECGATALAAGPCQRAGASQKMVAKSTIPKRGPPPACPKKVDYKKPQMTKAMMQRLKHTEKFREEMERKERERQEALQVRRPKRTMAPPGGDARMRQQTRAPRPKSKEPIACSTIQEACPAQTSSRPPSRGASAPCARGKTPTGAANISTRTRTLAASMNADIVQAEPLQGGTIDNVIIPPGTINSERTTIVSIPQQQAPPPPSPPPSSNLSTSGGNSAANRSVQVISETLDEQDATETAMVNSKLQELQQARREFVMAVANVGGNALNLQDDDIANITPIAEAPPPEPQGPPTPRIYRCPSIDNEYFIPQYSVDDPGAEARRQYLRERGKYVDPFAQLHRPPEDPEEYIEPPEQLPPGVFDDDDDRPPPPTSFGLPRRDPYEYLPCDVERIERFFDLEHFPPPQSQPQQQSMTPRPPPGRECLNQDLWELDDPWFIEADDPDLIQF